MQASREFDSLFWGGGNGPQRRPGRPQIQVNSDSNISRVPRGNVHNFYQGQAPSGDRNYLSTGSGNQDFPRQDQRRPPLRSAPNSFPTAGSAPYLVPAGSQPKPSHLQPPYVANTGSHLQPSRGRQNAPSVPYPVSPGVPLTRPSTTSPLNRRPSPPQRPATASPSGHVARAKQDAETQEIKADSRKPSRERSNGTNRSNNNTESRSQHSDRNDKQSDRPRADLRNESVAKKKKKRKSRTPVEKKARGTKAARKAPVDKSRKADGRKGRSRPERRDNARPKQPVVQSAPAIVRLPEWPQAPDEPVEWSDKPDRRRPKPVKQEKPPEKKRKKKSKWGWLSSIV